MIGRHYQVLSRSNAAGGPTRLLAYATLPAGCGQQALPPVVEIPAKGGVGKLNCRLLLPGASETLKAGRASVEGEPHPQYGGKS
jgi:hypothetical protein